jgi:serine protease inhibitor
VPRQDRDCPGCAAAYARTADTVVGMTAPDARFALALHRLVAADPDRGFAWSPYSVASALGVTAAGARGKTLDELTAVLGDLGPLASALSAGGSLPAAKEANLAVANTLWADLRLPVSAGYLDAVKSWPGGSARTVDLAGDLEGSRVTINADVERTTRGLIKDLLADGVLSPDTAAIVVNALWLKVAWVASFPKAMTKPRPFHAPSGTADVPTMARTGRMPYATGDGWTLVSLPAAGDIALDILVADDASATLEADTVDSLLAAARPVEVDLELPRFRVTGQTSLKDALAGLGVRRLFDPAAADLSGITDGAEHIWVDDVVHKCVLTVDEEGLEGAAATAVVAVRMSAMSPPPTPVPVHVDRPFYVLVRSRSTTALYFLARITTP